MSKKMKVLIAVLVGIITLTVSGTMAVLAQDDDELEPEEETLTEELEEIAPRFRLFMANMASNEILSRVADILDISEEELRDAIEEAREDIIAERGEKAFYGFLDRAVAEDLISEEEAQEIREWWQQKPEALDWALLQKAFCVMRQHPGPLANNGWQGFKGIKRGIQQRLKNCAEPELKLEMLERAIDEGLITDTDAGDIKAWAGNKPAALNQMAPQARIMEAVRGGQMIAVPGGRPGPRPNQRAD